MPDLPFDPWELNHLEVRARVRDLSADAPFGALLERERDREKGPRPSVVRALEARLPQGERTAPRSTPTPPSELGPLPEPNWDTRSWRGHSLYVHRRTGFQTFDLGEMYEYDRKVSPPLPNRSDAP